MTLVIVAAAFAASLLTLFSGFGLGTLLTPVVAIFFPVAVAVALTAFVHLLNSLFKLTVLWRKVDWPVTLRFGVPVASGWRNPERVLWRAIRSSRSLSQRVSHSGRT